MTAKLSDVDPQASLADVPGHIAAHPAQRLAELLPWNWQLIQPTPASLDAAARATGLGPSRSAIAPQ